MIFFSTIQSFNTLAHCPARGGTVHRPLLPLPMLSVRMDRALLR